MNDKIRQQRREQRRSKAKHRLLRLAMTEQDYRDMEYIRRRRTA